jgi:hypothetical protein
MKDIMAKESTNHNQGVPSFAYDPADKLPEQTLLFKLSRPLDDLKEQLVKEFAGQKITMHRIYEKHNVDTPYIKKNYKSVLMELYDKKEIEAISKTGKPPKPNSFGDEIIVTFKK